MNKIVTSVITSILLVGTIACSNNAKTSADAPNSTENTGEVPTTKTTENNQNDAASKVRKDQLNSDIRANEQRNNVTGGDAVRGNNDLSGEVRSKLEANIPNGNLTVAAKDGAIVVAGTVQVQNQLDQIEPLARQIKGVKSVSVTAKVAPAVPEKK
jgi:hyperosmotically inducible periplasmic protein